MSAMILGMATAMAMMSSASRNMTETRMKPSSEGLARRVGAVGQSHQ